MGQLVTRVREAEERLAGLARALQSAWEEELAEARTAREDAARARARAEAMQEAAEALGRAELASRLRELAEQLGASEEGARRRIEELSAVHERIEARLGTAAPAAALPSAPERTPTAPSAPAPEPTPAPEKARPPAEPPRPPPAPETARPAPAVEPEKPPPAVEPVKPAPAPEPTKPAPPEATAAPVAEQTKPAPEPAPVEAPKAAAPAPAAKAPGAEVGELTARLDQLNEHVQKIARAAARMGAAELREVVREYVALARLLGNRFDAAGLDGFARIGPALARLGTLAGAQAGEIAGLRRDESADWARIASRARARRQELTTSRTKPGNS